MTTLGRSSVVMPADWMPGPQQGYWTYRDYAALPQDGRRYEVVSGVLYMAPSPSMEHQGITLEVAAHLRNFVQLTGSGRVFVAPADVELSPGDVVQPDVFVILREHLDRITSSRVRGAPDLVVEVASPGTARHDLREKQDAYARAGVTEYWIVIPGERTVELLVLKDRLYRSLGIFYGAATLPSQIIPGLPVAVERFFIFS
jgi:Uma2 family endonuclease